MMIDDDETVGNDSGVASASLCFPLARVKKIIKMDRDVGTIQNDALLAITAAAVADFSVPWLTN